MLKHALYKSANDTRTKVYQKHELKKMNYDPTDFGYTNNFEVLKRCMTLCIYEPHFIVLIYHLQNISSW